MSPAPYKPDPPTVREMVDALSQRFAFEVLAGSRGLDRALASPRLQKPGLALTGGLEYLHEGRLQVLGRSEARFLNRRSRGAAAAIGRLCDGSFPALLLVRGLAPPPTLVDAAEAGGVPLLSTAAVTGEVMEALFHFMAVRLAPRKTIHGVLMDIFGLGVLLLGESGIGKSECALELVTRGHRLVADDAVELRLIEDELIGASPELSRYYLEVRGLGLINAREMFGITAVAEIKAVEQAIRLVRFDATRSYERLGEEQAWWEVLGHRVPLREVPVAPGRNLAVILEIAARQQLLRARGIDAAAEIQAELARRLSERPPGEEESR